MYPIQEKPITLLLRVKQLEIIRLTNRISQIASVC
jgi:hypothetical protein